MKQRCESKQFIVINDKLKVYNRVFISNNQSGGESKTAKRQKERECERQSIAGSEGYKRECERQSIAGSDG